VGKPDPAVREGQSVQRNCWWLIKTFCEGGWGNNSCHYSKDTAWNLVMGFMQYGKLALLVAVSVVREEHFTLKVLPSMTTAATRRA
jgi:hypothetical protein